MPTTASALEVERVGPFVPPFDPLWMGDIPVVTDSFRRSIEASGLRGACFREVRKARIVRIDWRGWDRERRAPRTAAAGRQAGELHPRPRARPGTG